MNVPMEFEGAKLMYYADSGRRPFGLSQMPGGTGRKIKYLAVAQHSGKSGTYLFACADNWQVVGDLFYHSIEEAKLDAERFYQTGPLSWVKV